MAKAPTTRRRTPRVDDFLRTGPGELAGRYLRCYWQPIYHAVDLPRGRAIPLQVMGEKYTLFRGEGGSAFLLGPRCPHRQMQLSAGWVEGNCIRCFYHGWKYDGTGQCVEQPAEDSAFAHKVALDGYPTEEYLGLIFAYLGPGAPPPFPRYADFERFAGLVEIDSYRRDCNFFQNLENALDMNHVAFVHGDNRASFRGMGHAGGLNAEESDWGISYAFTRPDGNRRVQQFGMPNKYNLTALPNDPDIGWQESLFWWVPVDDKRHIQFSLHRVPAMGAAAERIKQRRAARRSTIDLSHQDVCEDILAGRLGINDVDASRVDLVRLQDDVAQIGQGRLMDRTGERLGRGDIGVSTIRKLWARETKALAEGASLKNWTRPAGFGPEAWQLDEAASSAVAPVRINDDMPMAELIDVRPFVEVAEQTELLRGAVAS